MNAWHGKAPHVDLASRKTRIEDVTDQGQFRLRLLTMRIAAIMLSGLVTLHPTCSRGRVHRERVRH